MGYLVDPNVTNLYVISCPEFDAVKIGISSDVIGRLRNLQSSNPCELFLEFFVERVHKKLEKQLHKKLESSKIRNEWFVYSNELTKKTLRELLEWSNSSLRNFNYQRCHIINAMKNFHKWRSTTVSYWDDGVKERAEYHPFYKLAEIPAYMELKRK